MKKIFKGTVLHFAQEDLRELIPADIIARIKQKDKEPTFKAFAVAHEGEASAEMVGQGGSKILRYFRDAIVRIGDALGFGTPAFYRHEGNDGTGNNTGREAIGELVGKTTRNIGGKLHAIAAFYIYPKFKSKNLNAASYEADVEMSLEEDGGVRVDNVARITGVALSDMDRPGFPGATLMATMQAFENGARTRPAKGAVNHMENITVADVKAFIRNGSYSPLDFFNMDQIMEVPKVRNTFDKADRVEKENKEFKEKLETVTKEADAKVKAAQVQLTTITAQEVLKAIAAERKLSPQQLAHANKNFKAFTPTSTEPEVVKRELQVFVDGQLKDLDETLKGLGLKPEEHGGTGWKPKEETAEEKATREAAEAAGKGGAGSGDAAAAGEKDMTDPKHNPLIPQ